MTPVPSQPGITDRRELNVDLVVAAVRRCAGVDDLDEGLMGSAVTYLPGRRILGVRIDHDGIYLQVRARWGATAPELGRQIRSAVTPLAGGRAVAVAVTDISDPPSAPPALIV